MTVTGLLGFFFVRPRCGAGQFGWCLGFGDLSMGFV